MRESEARYRAKHPERVKANRLAEYARNTIEAAVSYLKFWTSIQELV